MTSSTSLSASSITPSPTPPSEPKPWHWRCHKCHRINPLACTNRCLNCSHRFCSRPSSPSKKSICTTNFDFRPWNSYTEWRRDTLEHASNPQHWTATTIRLLKRANTEKRWMTDTGKKFWIEDKRRAQRRCARMRRFRERTHDCSIDCSYPSECLHERRKAIMEESSTDSSTEEDEEMPSRPTRVTNSNGRVPLPRSLPRKARSPSPAPKPNRDRTRRFRHLHFLKVGTRLNPKLQEPIPESPKSPESP